VNLGFVIDTTACIGCHACSTACKSENEVPLGVNRTWVKSVEVGQFPDVRRSFQVTRCNHCANPPCVAICPTGAMHQRPDGIVDFASDACIGCKGCTQACPYDAIHMEPESHTAAKCNFCAHRVDVGLEPACVVVCPAHAILAGDLDDPASEVARAVARRDVSVRRPEQGTAPKLFYVDGHAPSLHPTAAGHGRSFSAAEVRAPTAVVEAPEAQGLPAGGPIAAAMIRVSYGAQHDVQWHWPIPAYLITKHLAGGGFFFLAVAALVGRVPAAAMTWGGLFGLVMTFVTLGLLIYDLDRPDRFLYLLTRPQWRSWIARAAWLLTAFTALAVAWWTVELVAPASALRPLFAALVAPVALLTSIYSAFLLAQAEGRDLWQSAHLPVLMTAQGVALGAAPFALLPGPFGEVAQTTFGVGLLVSLLVTLVGDLGVPHATDSARRALVLMTRGPWAREYWLGGILTGHLLPLGLLAAGLPGPALAAAAVGLFFQAHALVMAPQAVPNS
jgi:Fe-S-cluster-containing dehydrogenase component/formate-dependent nitrite reductase membrane component NrfD